MKPYKGECKDCGCEKWINNARCLCEDCVYKRNHEGKSRSEVKKDKPVTLKRKPVKSLKNGEKRKEVLMKDREIYRELFETRPQVCEECGINLPNQFEDENGNLIAIWRYSHILGKGSHPEFRHKIENFNLLCFNCHYNWEFSDRSTMKIFDKNKKIVENFKG